MQSRWWRRKLFYDEVGFFSPKYSCSKLFKGLECLKNSQRREINRESIDETAKGVINAVYMMA